MQVDVTPGRSRLADVELAGQLDHRPEIGRGSKIPVQPRPRRQQLDGEAVRLDPRVADVHFNLARLDQQKGDQQAALRHVSRFRALTRNRAD